MMMRWLALIVCACGTGAASALAFSLLRPRTHNIASIFGEALFGGVVVVAALFVGWLWFVKQV
jgi:hypothetical protein